MTAVPEWGEGKVWAWEGCGRAVSQQREGGERVDNAVTTQPHTLNLDDGMAFRHGHSRSGRTRTRGRRINNLLFAHTVFADGERAIILLAPTPVGAFACVGSAMNPVGGCVRVCVCVCL